MRDRYAGGAAQSANELTLDEAGGRGESLRRDAESIPDYLAPGGRCSGWLPGIAGLGREILLCVLAKFLIWN